MKKNIALAFLVFFAFQSLNAQTNQRPANPKIKFIILELSLVDGEEQLELIKQEIKDGWLKRQPSQRDFSETHLRCSFIDLDGNIQQQFNIAYPLHKHIEYADEDELLQRVEVAVEKEIFQLRIRHNKAYQFLKVEKVNADQVVEKELMNLSLQTN